VNTCICENRETQNKASTVIDFHVACTKAGLKPNEYLVLAALVEAASLIDGEPNVAMSRYEIAKRTGISWQRAQRALGELQLKGLIGRRQNAKCSGETAITLVSESAYALFGLKGGAKIGPDGLPADFGPLLAGESEDLIHQIAAAWAEGSHLPPTTGEGFRGGSRRWVQIEFLLSARIEELRQLTFEAMATAEASQADEEAGRYSLALPDGAKVVFDQSAMREATAGLEVAIRGADVRFARDVLELICERTPERVNSGNAARLAAEIMFSRQKGFVWKHDYEAACRILATVIGRGTWQRPNRIDDAWYRSASRSVKRLNPQGVQECAA